MFTRLAEISECSGEDPIRGSGSLPVLIQEMSFSKDEIAALFNTLAGDARLVALVALSAVGRRTEVVTLKRSQIVNCRVMYLKTKNGKRRAVPISAEPEHNMMSTASTSLFNVDCRKFCGVRKQIKPDIPPGQSLHILRHIFTGHVMMNEGNIMFYSKCVGSQA